MKKQSSIEWLVEELSRQTRLYTKEEIIEQAKQIHKQEIEDAYWDGGEDVPITIQKCEQYYKNTYEKEN